MEEMRPRFVIERALSRNCERNSGRSNIFAMVVMAVLLLI